MLTVGHDFPHFTAQACLGANPNRLHRVTNATLAQKWGVFAFYPKDFTFVCPTELVELSRRSEEFAQRGALIFGASTDNEYAHLAWCESHPGLRELRYPLLAAQKLAADLGILHPEEGVCLRATYIVSPTGKIEWVCVNNLNTGRSVEEILRALDAIQSGKLCPCDWKPGDGTLN